MQLHLVVPGLLWPKDSVRETTQDLPLPALAALLGRGRTEWQPSVPYEHWLCRSFGVNADEPPCGALRALGDGIQPGMRSWICVDPVPLRVARDALIIGSPGELELTQPEADALVSTLNSHLAEVGEFVAPSPARWYVRLKRAAQIRTHPLSTIIGRSVEAFLPQGPGAREWRRVVNEAQVLLHNHPVNAAREEAGKPTANSVWPWGAGSLPSLVAAPARGVWSDNPVVRGLAKLASVPCRPVPRHADELAGVPSDGRLVLVEDLADAAHRLDPEGWRSAVAGLEQRWFAPLLAALPARQIHSLQLTALGDEAILRVTLDPTELWKFWRRPKSLQAFASQSPGR